MGLPGVKVYTLNSEDTLETNSAGEVNIDIFPADVPIVFAFPYFKKAVYKKQQLAAMNNVVYLERSEVLLALNQSNLTAKEYSEDLPFFVNIVNLDENSLLDIDDNSGGSRVIAENYEGAITVFRGLEADKMLLTIDGLRLNDEIHKNGKVEGLLSFDKANILRIQQIYGTPFTIYSPEASGGVIHYFTKIPTVTHEQLARFKLQFVTKYMSASNTFINNVNFMVSFPNVASFTSLTYGKYGEIAMGKNRKYLPSADSLYGLNLYYIDNQSDTDIVVKNENPYLQHGTDFDQIYFLQKFRVHFSDFTNLFINFHYVNTSEMGIYSGMTEINIDHLRFAECKFEPQNKFIANANLLWERNNRFFSVASFVTSFVTYNEYRLTRKLNNPVALHQKENIDVYKFNADFVKTLNISRIIYGFEYAYNDLQSNAFFQNVRTDSTWQGMTRYPTNGGFSHSASAYFGYKWMGLANFHVNFGIRYNFKYTEANFSNISPQLPLTFTQKIYYNQAPAAAISLNSFPFSFLQIKAMISYSQHLPIIDDFGKIMVKDFIVAIPTDNLRSEKNYNTEIGINFLPSDNFKIFGSVFATYSQDAIILKDTTLNGEDSLYFGTDRYNIATHVNIPKALIYGYSTSINFNHFFDKNNKKGIKINGSVNYIQGVNLSDTLPLPHISPVYGNGAILFIFNKLSLKFSTEFNGQKPIDQLSPVGEDYIEKAASEGFLAWQIYNARLTYKINKTNQISIGVDNIFDKFYRRYATAVVSPGRNIVFSAKFVIK